MNVDPSFMKFFLTIFPWFLIGGWFFYALIVLFSKDFREMLANYYIIEAIPNVFVTLGLFGTFTGITYGLIHFNTDPDVIKESIKLLLDGLKSALETSIVGIFLSLISSKVVKYKINSKLIKPPDSEELLELKLLNKNVSEFREDISQTHHDAIVKALQDVLENFNDDFMGFIDKLVEQNFEKLTESIDQLITWQLEYRQDIQGVKETYESLVTKHHQFVSNTDKWVKNLEEISGQSSRLQKIVDEFNEAFNENGNLSIILKSIKESANDLQKVTNDFSRLTTKMNETTDAIKTTEGKVTEWTNNVSKVSDTSGQIVDHLATIQNFRVQDLNKLSDEFNKRLATTFGSFDGLMKAYIENLEKRVRNK